jgi:CRP/FNR family transcriptional regulator
MLKAKEFERITRLMPFLGEADDDLLRELKESAFLVAIPPGRDVFVEGDRIEAIPLLLSGSVRVYQIGETGREVTLYRFRPGESCVLTANAILGSQTFPAIATVEEEAEAVMVPAETFRRWVGRYDLWRDFFIDLVSQRLASVMNLVDEVVFRRLDRRIASFLTERSETQNPLGVTHQQIASELGSSREVISRILEDLVGNNLIRTGRGEIEILDRPGLEDLARM